MSKFKNYRNKYTKNNIILTTDDLMRMTLHEMSRREPELRSQYKQIGLPTTADMQNSSNVVYVNAYTRADGTQVRGYWRSKGGGGSIIEPAQKYPETKEPTVVIDERYPDYPIEDNPNDDMPNWKVLPPDEVIIDDDGTVTHRGRVVYPDQNDGYENVENPSPDNLPTKAPDGPIEYPNGGNDGGIWGKIGDVLGGVGGVLGTAIQFLPYIIKLLSATNGSSNTTVPVSSLAGVPHQSAHPLKPIKFENVDNLENVDIDFEDIEPLYGDKSVNKLFPLAPSQTINNSRINPSNQIKQMIPEGKAINTKPKELTYEPPKFQDSKPIHLPSATANPLSQGTAEYMNKLLQTTTNGVKDFGKGVVQGLSSIGVGLGKRYGNKIRQAVGKPPLSQEEMNNLYSNVLGKPEQNGANKTGKFIGEIIPFLLLPTVEVASFPLITNLLLTALYQSFIDSATRSVIDNGVSKKLIPDVIKGVALALLNTLLAHGLLKNVDQSKLLKELEKRLQNLVDELAEILPNTIRQADGTVVLKKSYSMPEEIYKDDYLDYSYEAQKEMMELLNISKAEFMKVVSQVDTLYKGKYKGVFEIVHHTFDHIYKIKNYGFHKYIFCDKIPNI